MRTIQEVGNEILTNNPKSFYIFCGCEYGIKLRYISQLQSHYQGNYESYERVQDVINLMRTKRLIPLQPSVYVIRYDDEFVSSLSDKTKSLIESTKIIGTIVCIYEDKKQVQKCNKYLGSYTVSIDPVNPQFISKYLHVDYPGIPDKLIDFATECSSDYYQAQNICAALQSAPVSLTSKLDISELKHLFGYQDTANEKMLKTGIAARNFDYCMKVLDENYSDWDTIYYTILQTLIELDKVKSSKYSQSDLQEYGKYWNVQDIYYMFENTYDALKTI